MQTLEHDYIRALPQMKYYAHHYGNNPDAYLADADHKWFDACVRFCERYGQAAFDPACPSKPLAYFAPMLREVFGRKAFDPEVVQEGV